MKGGEALVEILYRQLSGHWDVAKKTFFVSTLDSMKSCGKKIYYYPVSNLGCEILFASIVPCRCSLRYCFSCL